MNLTKIIIITGRGADSVSIDTDLPSPCPGLSNQPLDFHFEVAAGNGIEYCNEHFPGVPIEVIVIRKAEFTFGRKSK